MTALTAPTTKDAAVDLRRHAVVVVAVVGAAAGRPAPDFVFANARDYGYFLLLLDSASARALAWEDRRER